MGSHARPSVTSLERATHPPPPQTNVGRRTFVDVYNDRYRPMVEIARLTTGSNALAEELVQDAFADLYPDSTPCTPPTPTCTGQS